MKPGERSREPADKAKGASREGKIRARKRQPKLPFNQENGNGWQQGQAGNSINSREKMADRVVFFHTGGTPALFAYRQALVDYLK